jgi:hypothetical protein
MKIPHLFVFRKTKRKIEKKEKNAKKTRRLSRKKKITLINSAGGHLQILSFFPFSTSVGHEQAAIFASLPLPWC